MNWLAISVWLYVYRFRLLYWSVFVFLFLLQGFEFLSLWTLLGLGFWFYGRNREQFTFSTFTAIVDRWLQRKK